MKILLLYKPNSISDALVSSAHMKLQNNPIPNVEIEIFNLNNRNLKKYLLKRMRESDEGIKGTIPNVIYVLGGESSLISSDSLKIINELKIKLVKYSRELAYKPSRVPGNELPTIAYFLADKIKCDISSNFKIKNVYHVDKYHLKIEEQTLGDFELNHKYGSMIFGGTDCYETMKEAIDRLEFEIDKRIANLNRGIVSNNSEITMLHKKIDKLQNQMIKYQSDIEEFNKMKMRLKYD